MKRPIIIVIAISFIVTILQIFVPIFASGLQLPLLIINLLLIFDVNILQKRPSLPQVDFLMKDSKAANITIFQQPDIKLYFALSLFCIVISFSVLLGYLLGSIQRDGIYDIAILIPLHLYFLIFGTIE